MFCFFLLGKLYIFSKQGTQKRAFFYLRDMDKHLLRIPLHLVELEGENYHLLLESALENEQKCWWVLDTGASKSVLDVNREDLFFLTDNVEEEVKSAGIGDVIVETAMGTIPEIRFGEFTINNWQVALIDLGHLNKLYRQFSDKTIGGLLGSDFFLQHAACIDYEKMELTLKI